MVNVENIPYMDGMGNNTLPETNSSPLKAGWLKIRSFPFCDGQFVQLLFGGFLKWWYPTTMGFPTKNDHHGHTHILAELDHFLTFKTVLVSKNEFDTYCFRPRDSLGIFPSHRASVSPATLWQVTEIMEAPPRGVRRA